MREIKFRAWDKTESEWIDIKYLRFEFNDFWYLQEQDEYENEIDPPYFSGDEDFELMQYTGLKDKNGVDIYEGDIIRSDKDSPIGTIVTAKVYWKGAGFALLTTRGSDTTSAYLELLNPFCEVIGNIYEHPHLLEVSE
ncbi:hypothetical protein IR194_07845 [Exiguobacterium sp. PBE]|nr:hypothetical protein IR194_07845 [Exiguobacterium sp. PBE]